MELQQQQQQQQPLSASLRWLQVCLLLLFGHDVLCFSLGYPFLPLVFGGPATGFAFASYGLASIAVLLLLLFISSAPANSVAGSCSSAARRYRRIVAATALAAVAGAANTAIPHSYTMMLLTKVIQGAASALYFCESLSLVAAVYPRAYRTQAMAFISAGLTVGDALGPVLGGAACQAAGLQAALSLQPATSLTAVAAWACLLLWPKRQWPWQLQRPHQQHGSSQHPHLVYERHSQAAAAAAAAPAAKAAAAAGCCSVCSCCSEGATGKQACACCSTGDLVSQPQPHAAAHISTDCSSGTSRSTSSSSLLEPLLPPHHMDQDIITGHAAGVAQHLQLDVSDAAAGDCDSVSGTPKQSCPLQQPAAATATPNQPTAAATTTAASVSRPQLLHQLLRRPAIASLCLLALLAQAARTAVDLLLPIMLAHAVPPGIIGLLFAGEAAGSVVAPFVVDWMLYRHSVRRRGSRDSSSARTTAGGVNPGSSAAAVCDGARGSGQGGSSSRQYASFLLLLSAVGMSVCCALVLTLWQLAALAGPAVSRPAHNTPPAQLTGMLAATPAGTAGATGARRLFGPSNTAAAAAAATTAAAAAAAAHASAVVDAINSTLALSAAPAAGWWVAGAPVPACSCESTGAAGEQLWAMLCGSSCGNGSRSVVCGVMSALVALSSARHVPWGGAAGLRGSGVLQVVPVGSMASAGVSVVRQRVRSPADTVGLVELLIIGVVLMLLGSWHSSCETLIYTVLTDIISPPEAVAGPPVGFSASSESGNESESESESESQSKSEGACDSQAAQGAVVLPMCSVTSSACAAVSLNSAASQASSEGGSCGVDVEVELGENEGAAAVCWAAAAAAAACANSLQGSVSAVNAPLLPHATGTCCLQTDQNSTRKGCACAAAAISNSDAECVALQCAELTMVLYVLFWVCGFSAGAGVVGLLPSTRLLVAMAAVLAALLLLHARWTWVAIG